MKLLKRIGIAQNHFILEMIQDKAIRAIVTMECQ